MESVKIVKVATRMLLDVITVWEKKETDYEIGCRCKDTDIAKALHKLLTNALQDCPVSVVVKEDLIVVIVPLTQPSSPSSPSSPQHHPSQIPLPPSPPELSPLASLSSS